MDAILQRVAKYADLDTRRALGVFGRLPARPEIPFRTQAEIWNYWPGQKKALFFCPDPKGYEFEVHEGLVYDDELWSYTENSSVRALWKTRKGRYAYAENGPKPLGIRFSFAQNPQFIIE